VTFSVFHARGACVLALVLMAGILWTGLVDAQAPTVWIPPPPPPAPSADGMDIAPDIGIVVPPVSPPLEQGPVVYPAATVQTLDKITGRVRQFDIDVDQTLRAGQMAVTLRACRARPEDELPDSAAFLEVNEIRGEDGTLRRLFTGWMFASTPAASALEHPVYDVWLVACRTSAKGSSR
jgi:hypothetical protein